MKDHFEQKAANWDAGNIRVNGATIIADAINDRIHLNETMEIMDFGVGTGLLGFEIAKRVKKVYGVDTSKSMLEQLQEKNTAELSIEVYHQDIVKTPIQRDFHGMVSSMTLHHVEELETFFDTLYTNVKENGFIAIADLELEDGTFHSDNTDVFHFGFEEDLLCEVAKKAGFKNVEFANINTIKKPHREFGVFLLTAIK